MTSEQWYVDTEIVEIRTFKIPVKRHLNAEKPWIVLLHGFPTCSYDWYKIWPGLTEHFQVLTFDFLGFGQADKPYPHTYSIIEQAEITLAILSHFEITSCYILCHDYGVSVVQEIISRLENHRANLHLRKIIFLNGGLFSEKHRPRLVQTLLLSPVGKLVGFFLNKRTLRKNFNQIFGPNTPPSQKEIDELWSLIVFNKGKRIFHLLIRYINDRIEHRDRWVSDMQKTSIPMKLVNGPEDPISGHHLLEYYQEIIPNPSTLSLKGIGHYPNLEAPEQVLEAVISFFRKA